MDSGTAAPTPRKRLGPIDRNRRRSHPRSTGRRGPPSPEEGVTGTSHPSGPSLQYVTGPGERVGGPSRRRNPRRTHSRRETDQESHPPCPLSGWSSQRPDGGPTRVTRHRTTGPGAVPSVVDISRRRRPASATRDGPSPSTVFLPYRPCLRPMGGVRHGYGLVPLSPRRGTWTEPQRLGTVVEAPRKLHPEPDSPGTGAVVV